LINPYRRRKSYRAGRPRPLQVLPLGLVPTTDVGQLQHAGFLMPLQSDSTGCSPPRVNKTKVSTRLGHRHFGTEPDTRNGSSHWITSEYRRPRNRTTASRGGLCHAHLSGRPTSGERALMEAWGKDGDGEYHAETAAPESGFVGGHENRSAGCFGRAYSSGWIGFAR